MNEALRVNGVEIPDEAIAALLADLEESPRAVLQARRMLAARELLRQRAREELPAIEDEEAAIDALLERALRVPVPTDEECRRFYAAQPERYTSGELIEADHILFAVTPGVPVPALRQKAEAVLREALAAPERFGELAREYSNCPSAEQAGNLGQLTREAVVPEFWEGLNAQPVTGVMPVLIRSRYGFHIVRVARRVAGRALPFEHVQPAIAQALRSRVAAKALAQYLAILAGEATIEGVDFEAAESPLVQ